MTKDFHDFQLPALNSWFLNVSLSILNHLNVDDIVKSQKHNAIVESKQMKNIKIGNFPIACLHWLVNLVNRNSVRYNLIDSTWDFLVIINSNAQKSHNLAWIFIIILDIFFQNYKCGQQAFTIHIRTKNKDIWFDENSMNNKKK